MSLENIMDGWQTRTYISDVEKRSLQTGGYVDTTDTAKPYSKTINPPAQVGWICPKCGAGLAPWVSRCSCQDKWEVTC